MKKTDIESIVDQFQSQCKNSKDHRYISFDYCYNYFRQTNDVTYDMEKSCLALGFYLASWGMFRGSSFILQKNVKCFEPTIEYVATLKKLKNSVWV